jgi:hypothetical protein
MSERTPVAVEARFDRDGTIAPLAIGGPAERQAVTSVARQWDSGRQCYFDVQVDTGKTVILCLDVHALRWYVIGTWGRAQMA